jgi:hypothetical protein
VDQFLSKSSWDKTWSDMNTLIETSLQSKQMGARRDLAAIPALASSKGVANV